MAGLCPLAQLQFDHLDLGIGGSFSEFSRVKPTIRTARPEIARAKLPDQIAAMLSVVRRDAAFAGVMKEAARLCALVQRPDGICGNRAIAHCGNVQKAGGIGVLATGPDLGAKRRMRLGRLWRDRVVQPFILLFIDIVLGAEGPFVEVALGALVDERPFVAGKRHAVLVALKEVLPHFRADRFQQKTQMGGHRIVPQDRMAGLGQVAQPQKHRCCKKPRCRQKPPYLARKDRHQHGEKDQQDRRPGDQRIAQREDGRQHGPPLTGSWSAEVKAWKVTVG